MDPRVARTQASLQDALLELARHQQLDEITVGDIAKRAGVNRSSFYLHYSDKETLLADALERAVNEVSDRMLTAKKHNPPEMPGELLHYLAHIAEHVALYRRVLGEHGSAVVAARLRNRIELIVRDAVDEEGSVFAGLPIDVVAAGIAGSALGVITAWLGREPLPPVEEAGSWIWRVLLGPGMDWTPNEAASR